MFFFSPIQFLGPAENVRAESDLDQISLGLGNRQGLDASRIRGREPYFLWEIRPHLKVEKKYFYGNSRRRGNAIPKYKSSDKYRPK